MDDQSLKDFFPGTLRSPRAGPTGQRPRRRSGSPQPLKNPFENSAADLSPAPCRCHGSLPAQKVLAQCRFDLGLFPELFLFFAHRSTALFLE